MKDLEPVSLFTWILGPDCLASRLKKLTNKQPIEPKSGPPLERSVKLLTLLKRSASIVFPAR